MKPTFQTFGWQHFQFQIPADWDLVEEHGNEDKGYFQLADLERPRLEMKWQKIPAKNKLLDMVASHAKKIGWENNKIVKLNNNENAYSIENRTNDSYQQVLFLKGNTPKARLAVIRIFYLLNENGSKLVKEIVTSFQDNLFAEQSLWTYYQNSLVIPSVYKRIKSEINAGSKCLTFAYKNKVVYSWTISLASHFCPHKPFNQTTLNEWVYDLLKGKFNKELKLEKVGFIENIETETKTSILGRFLLRNIFHFSHHWKIIVKYHGNTDTLKVFIFNYTGQKDLKRFQNYRGLVN
jgi:hypothetical protein